MEWKKKLQNNVNKIITSKGISNYKMVVSLFEKQFFELTKELWERNNEFARVVKVEDTAIFSIYNIDLGLRKEQREVIVIKGKEKHSEAIGKIIFENGFSFVRFNDNDKRFYLDGNIVDKFFKLAFQDLHEIEL